MRMMNWVVTGVLAALLALEVWGTAMRYIAGLRESDGRRARDLRLAA